MQRTLPVIVGAVSCGPIARGWALNCEAEPKLAQRLSARVSARPDGNRAMARRKVLEQKKEVKDQIKYQVIQKMKLVLESTVGGQASGYLHLESSEHEPVQTLLDSYCDNKELASDASKSYRIKTKDGFVLENYKSLAHQGINDGDVLYVTIEGREDSAFGFFNWWYFAIGALVTGLGGLALAVGLYTSKGPAPFDYGVVIDGGSSHTSFYVYKWEGSKWRGTGVVKEIQTCTVHDDIASYTAQISEIGNMFLPCMNPVLKAIPTAERSATPVYFAATAGMRLLNITNPWAAQLVLEGVRNVLMQSGLVFDYSQAEILPGDEEGQFSWVTVNYQLKNLGPFEFGARQARSAESTSGALDLGGASTQITMQINETSTMDEVEDLTLYGNNYTVYSQSYLCYGINEAIRRYWAQIIYGKLTEEIIESPCSPRGYLFNITLSKVFNSPCTMSIAPNETSKVVFIRGTGDFDQCQALVSILFREDDCRNIFHGGDCFERRGQPTVSNRDFTAFSTYYYVAHDLNVTDETTLQEFYNTTQHICALTWEEMLQIPILYPSRFVTLHLCLESLFVYDLLVMGYGFDADSWRTIKFVQEIDGSSIGWSLGYMTEQTNAFAPSFPQPLLVTSAFAALAVLFLLFLAIGALLTFHSWRMRTAKQAYNRKLVKHLDQELIRFL